MLINIECQVVRIFLRDVPSKHSAPLFGRLASPGWERSSCCSNGRLGVCRLHAGHIGYDLVCGWVVDLQGSCHIM